MIFRGLGINWDWGMGSLFSGGSATGLAWHRTEPVMGHIKHLFFESLVKMDHFQKEPPLNLKGDHLVKGIGNPALYPQKRTLAGGRIVG